MKGMLGTALALALAAAMPAIAQNKLRDMQQPDRDFLIKAVEANIGEVKLGKLAEKKADDKKVKQFARRMVQDHKKAEKQLKQAMTDKKSVLPTHVDQAAASLYDKLDQESGAQFDRDYMQAMVDDHQRDTSQFQDEMQNGKVDSLRNYAKETLPTLQQHLKMAKDINRKVTENEGR